MQRPMEEVMDVVEDRRWLASCNPRARAETVGPGRRRTARLLERWCLDALLSRARIIPWAILLLDTH